MDDAQAAVVHTLVEGQAVRAPQAPAVYEPSTDQRLTYAELWEVAGQLAHDLTDRGVGRAHVVGVRLDRSVDLIITMLGIARAGAAYLCLDADAPPDRHSMMLQQARASWVVEPPDSTDGKETVRGLRLVPHRTSADDHLRPATSPAAGRVSPDDPIYVMFTSGSTGEPKGTVIPHRAVRRLAVAPKFCTIEPGDQVANLANPAFDASTFEVWNTLVAGATVVILPSLTEITFTRWTKLVGDTGITTMFLTTSLFHLIARERPGAFGGLRTLVVGGEQLEIGPVRQVLAEGPPGRLVNGYGPTETTTFAAYFDCTEESLAGMERIPIGFPLQSTSLNIVDEQLQPVPPGATGELCIGGPGVALGYLDRPELTAQRFVTDPASGEISYRTGDLARMLATGAVELVGRVDRQIKLWGFRIELEEIESAIVATGLVDAAFVEKVDDGPDAMLVGFVLPARSATEAVELSRTLAGHLNQRLPAYMVPARWIVLSEVPLGPTGKVDRHKLLARFEADRVARTS